MAEKFSGDLAAYPDKFLRCRARRHAWDNEHFEPLTNGRGRVVGWIEHLTCLRCENGATREYDAELNPVKHGKIEYVDGYLVNTDEVEIPPQAARAEIVRRVTGHQALKLVK
jgi:hypothetical protein